MLDAFGSAHRCHASTYGISKYLPSYAGFLVQNETTVLDKALKQNKTLILGGAKVDDKIGVINNLIKTSNKLLIGGGMCFTFLKAKGYNIGESILSEEHIDYAKKLLKKYPNTIILPIDVVTQNGVKNIEDMSDKDIGYDIGPKTIKLFTEELKTSKLVLWNGPLGKQKFNTILAGGDITGASKYFNIELYYVSTGGGSTLEYLEGKKFKTLERLNGTDK